MAVNSVEGLSEGEVDKLLVEGLSEEEVDALLVDKLLVEGLSEEEVDALLLEQLGEGEKETERGSRKRKRQQAINDGAEVCLFVALQLQLSLLCR